MYIYETKGHGCRRRGSHQCAPPPPECASAGPNWEQCTQTDSLTDRQADKQTVKLEVPTVPHEEPATHNTKAKCKPQCTRGHKPRHATSVQQVVQQATRKHKALQKSKNSCKQHRKYYYNRCKFSVPRTKP